MKKVIMLLVDSLMPAVLEDCIRYRTVPALQFLKDRGRYWPDCVTVFPTMTASVDCSLITGVYPHEHRVPGLIWYNPDEKKIVNYINGMRCVQKLGISNCAENVLFSLNEKHLSKKVSTIFEDLAMKGKTSASINAIAHRGLHAYRLQLPFLMNAASGFRLRGELSGPDEMTLGAMVESELAAEIPDHLKGLRHSFGIDDAFAVEAVKRLIKKMDRQPDFMLVYFPDNDHRVHHKNPAHAEESLIQVDGRIQQILDLFGSWDEALNRCVFIVVSDHGQTRIGRSEQFNIDLDFVLAPFNIWQLGKPLGPEHDLVVANNERMSYVYPLRGERQKSIIDSLSKESRIDVIAWKENKGVRVREGGTGRELFFAKGGAFTDRYGEAWDLSGEQRLLDLRIEGSGLTYGDYPDALSRLYGALYSQDIPTIAITARPRYEFKSRYYPTHLHGGSHGSLHKYDSQIPLLIAGTDASIADPPRLVDLKPFIMRLFGT